MAAASREDRSSDRTVTVALVVLAFICGFEVVHFARHGDLGVQGSLAMIGLLVALAALVSETREAIHAHRTKRS